MIEGDVVSAFAMGPISFPPTIIQTFEDSLQIYPCVYTSLQSFCNSEKPLQAGLILALEAPSGTLFVDAPTRGGGLGFTYAYMWVKVVGEMILASGK